MIKNSRNTFTSPPSSANNSDYLAHAPYTSKSVVWNNKKNKDHTQTKVKNTTQQLGDINAKSKSKYLMLFYAN